jgi:hypothetical protein
MSKLRPTFDKVDRALEIRVIDWLQWSEFPESIAKNPDDSDMAQLALSLISKRKRAYQDLINLMSDYDNDFKKYNDKIEDLERKLAVAKVVLEKLSIGMEYSAGRELAHEALKEIEGDYFNPKPKRKKTMNDWCEECGLPIEDCECDEDGIYFNPKPSEEE